jgi:prolyl-tRNA synthetase
MRVRGSTGPEGICVIADLSVFSGTDFAAGANEADYHYVRVDPRRDFAITQEVDIGMPPSGARCATCGSGLTDQRGTIIARWTPLPAPAFAGEGGGEEHGAAAWLAIDLLATLEHVVAACADGHGIAWPALLAPADVHIVDLKAAEPAAQIAGALEARGLRVLLDDRPLAAGAKFTDADLIGCPLRVTVSPRSVQAGGGELSGRKGVNPSVIPLSEIPDLVHAHLAALMST